MTPDERRETPEQRRKRIIDDCYIEELTSGDYSEFDEYDHYDALLAYFDKHEPAIADAIRYGVSVNQLGQIMVMYPQPAEEGSRNE